MIAERYAGLLPVGWTGGEAKSKWWRGKLSHLYHLRRACSECGGEMSIDVSRAALDGTAKNAGLHLKRCATCRARAKALGTSSRPKVEGENPAALKHALAAGGDEAAQMTISTMRAELDGLYAQNRELRERLAKYETEPRMPWEN